MPNFTDDLKNKLKAGEIVPSRDYVGAIKSHFVSVLGEGTPIDKRDYDTVCKRVVQQYPILGDADNCQEYVSTKKN